MDAGDWIAIYAAVVATAAFAWQAVTYWDANRPRLDLRGDPVLIVPSEDAVASLAGLVLDSSKEAEGVHWYFDVRVSNTGRSRVQLNSLRVTQPRQGRRMRGWDASALHSFPIWLDPGESRALRLKDDHLGEARITAPFDVRVDTSKGKGFSTQVKLLGKESVIAAPKLLFDDLLERSSMTDQVFMLEIEELEEDEGVGGGGV